MVQMFSYFIIRLLVPGCQREDGLSSRTEIKLIANVFFSTVTNTLHTIHILYILYIHTIHTYYYILLHILLNTYSTN